MSIFSPISCCRLQRTGRCSQYFIFHCGLGGRDETRCELLASLPSGGVAKGNTPEFGLENPPPQIATAKKHLGLEGVQSTTTRRASSAPCCPRRRRAAPPSPPSSAPSPPSKPPSRGPRRCDSDSSSPPRRLAACGLPAWWLGAACPPAFSSSLAWLLHVSTDPALHHSAQVTNRSTKH